MRHFISFLCVLIFLISPEIKAQVDTSYLYGPKFGDANLDLRIYINANNYYYLEDGKTFSFRAVDGQPTNTYLPLAGFNTSQYTEGHMRRKNGTTTSQFIMNYRLLYPKNYDENYADGYPLIVMIHGYGERGNCWTPPGSSSSCYWSTTSWNPNTNNPPAPTATTGNAARLLNNDHNLLHGGKVHLDAVNLANGKLPNDPSLLPRAFPGFVLFPQNLNGWHYNVPTTIYDAIRLIRLISKEYNIDPNRIYIHGLSQGASGVYHIIRRAPWLFSAVNTMSAVDDGGLISNNLLQEVVSIPVRTFQGGKDTSPTPAKTKGYVNNFRNAGMNVRYYYYGNLGHGTWNTAYAEPDFFTWMLGRNKANPHLKYGIDYICSTSGTGPEMVFAKGFFAYQWEKDGMIIPGATSYSYTPATPGTYRGRFSRVPNPGPDDWNRWSDAITIREKAAVVPAISANYSTIFPNINGDNAVSLSSVYAASQSKEYASKYLWYKNGSLLGFPSTEDDTVNYFTITNTTFGAGDYTLKTIEGNCESVLSPVVSIRYNTTETVTAPANLTGTASSPGSAFLSWTDNVSGEKGFELWRRKGSTGRYAFVTLTDQDAVSYQDTGLEPGTEYHYKIRAVSNTSRSAHAPDNSTGLNVVVITPHDNLPPAPPQNLKVVKNGVSSITLSWTPGSDETGIKQYIVYYGTNSAETGSSQTYFTLTDLPVNTAYAITVRTQDFANQLSPPSNQVTGTTYFTGLEYEHSTGAWNSLTEINWNFVEFEGKVTTFTLSPRVQEDYFNFKYNGYLYIPEAATYQFRVSSDDGSMMFLEGFNPADLSLFRIINNDGIHGNTTAESSEIALSAGPHRVVVLYFDNTGGQSLTVQYRKRNADNSSWEPDWTTVPASMLTTGPYTPPANPAAPTQLVATAAGMTTINLAWQYNGAAEDQFEIYRSTAQNGTYSIINRTGTRSYADTTAAASTTYYYKLKTVAASGAVSSGFSNTASATTGTDNQPPTVPLNLHMVSQNFTNVAFSWNASSDNIQVEGYQILINNVVTDSSEIPGFMATKLMPNSNYNFTVKAFDASGNISDASNVLSVTTSAQATYYSKATGHLDALSTWGTNGDGSGSAPESFASSGRIFMIANRTSAVIDNPLKIDGEASRMIVPSGVTLTITDSLVAKVEVQGTATVNLDYAVAPEFISLSPASTINFNLCSTIPAGSYGNLSLGGTGIKNLSEGETIVTGIFATENIILKGAPSNTSILTVHGDAAIGAPTGTVAADNTIHFNFVKNGMQTLALQADFDVYQLSTSSNTVLTIGSGSTGAITIKAGSPNGGGLALNNGSSINIGNNTLELFGSGTVNSGNQTGAIATSGGSLVINSTASEHSNLYFQASQDTVESLTMNLTGSGQLNIQSPAKLRHSLKVNAGTLNANGNITLLSGPVNTAFIGTIEGSGLIRGAVNIERWINGIGRKYRYLSSPVDGLTVAGWQEYMPITGSFSGSSPEGSSASMHYYDEPQGGWTPYPPIGTSNQEPIKRGVGYSVYAWNGDADILMTMRGTPYQGNITFGLNPGTGNDDGWNLLGNPYASAITWNDNPDAWVKSGISPAVYVRDNSIGQFKFYDSETGNGNLTQGHIAPGQAFWVQATGSPALTVTEKAKYEDGAVLLHVSQNINTLMISLHNGALSDPAYIVLGDNYADAYHAESDAIKKLNDIFNLSTISNTGIDMAINKVSNRFCQKDIPLNIQNALAGEYSLVFSNLENLVDVEEIILTDNFANTTVNVREAPVYTFDITSNPNSSGAFRFVVSIMRIKTVGDFTVSASGVCRDNEAHINVSSTQPGTKYFALYNGLVVSDSVPGTGDNIILDVLSSHLQEGSNMLHVQADNGCEHEIISKEIIINNTPAPVAEVEESIFSICEGASVVAKASGTPFGGYYRWYDQEGNILQQDTVSTFTTPPVTQPVIFQVTAVHTNGCEGEPANIFVTPEVVPQPQIEFIDSTLTLATLLPENIFLQWYKDNEALSEYDTMMPPAGNGVYTVLVSLNGCSKVSAPYILVEDDPGTEEPGTGEPGTEEPGTGDPGPVTAIDPEQVPGINVYTYPNPVHLEFYVRLESATDLPVFITLTDMTGRTFYINRRIEMKPGAGVHKMLVPDHMTPGVYLVAIVQGEVLIKRRIVVVR